MDSKEISNILNQDHLTVEDIQKVVKYIDSIKDDYECAHAYEDELYETVLTMVSVGCKFSSILATEALKVGEIDFPRYCA